MTMEKKYSSHSNTEDLRFCSVQSWVCHGYVGNRCSVFALNQLGIEVDAVNTVQFSNHTGYGLWKGEKLTGEQLMNLFQGLNENHLDKYTHLISGYVSSPSTLSNLANVYADLKKKNPELIYACDPVMGDNGKLYVSQDLVEIYKNDIIPLADFLFPNQTECEFLTGEKITDEESAIKAIDILHSRGIKTVIITSATIPSSQKDPADFITLIGSTNIGFEQVPGQTKRFKIQVPRLDQYFSGTGDLFASLFTGWTSLGVPPSLACERSVNSIYSILLKTWNAKSQELKLIQSKSEIENPPRTLLLTHF